MRAIPIALAALFALVAATPARPRSLPMPSLEGPTTPADAATAVPTNAIFFLQLSLAPSRFSAFLAKGEGEPQPLNVAVDDGLALVFLDGLDAGREYTVSFVVDDAEGGGPRAHPATRGR